MSAAQDRLAEIKQRAEAATPGPWSEPFYVDEPGDQGWWIHNGQVGMKEGAVAGSFALNPNQEADGEFISHSRADVDWLIAEVERLRTGRPDRDDVVANWLKALRNQHPATTYQWQALDSALDDYRLRADCGLSLRDSTDGIESPGGAA
jgi:hypothetical protein